MGRGETVLIVTDDAPLAEHIERLLKEKSVSVLSCVDEEEALSIIAQQSSQIILIDTNTTRERSADLCLELRRTAGVDELAILAMVDKTDDDTIINLLVAGADDLINRTIRPLSFKARIDVHLRRIGAGRKLALKVHDSQVLINVTSRLVGSSDILENLFAVALVISEELNVDRCSVVLVRPQRDFGLVVASSDDPNMGNLAIDLDQYPEISAAIDSKKPVIIHDVGKSDLLKDVLQNVQDANVMSVALFPIVRRNTALGVIFLRFFGRQALLEERELVFCQTVANAASIALRNAEILELLKAKTREVEKVQTEAQDRLRDLKRYEDFFISALDGHVVIEQGGEIVFVNPKASEIFQKEASQLVGLPFHRFLLSDEWSKFSRMMSQFIAGKGGRSADFLLSTDLNPNQIVSISAGALFGEEGLMLLTIRDVTEERAMESMLTEAQERLVATEKRAAMTELAGAAAHELNQPLTSVMTSMALLRRLLGQDVTQQRVLTTMEQETERMAEIIRRLTKITSYATKEYVGDAKIIDIYEASSKSPEDGDD